MPRTLRVEYAQGICRRHLKNSIILQRHESFAKPFGPKAVLVWFTKDDALLKQLKQVRQMRD